MILMSLNDFYVGWRWVGFSLAIIALLTTTWFIIPHWHTFNVKQKFRFLSMMFFCVSFIYGTLQLALADVQPGFRNVIAVLGPLWMIAGTVDFPEWGGYQDKRGTIGTGGRSDDAES